MLWAAGRNFYGQRGDGTTYSPSPPNQVVGITNGVTAVAAGDTHALAILPDGTVWSWGKNADGQLGRGAPTEALLPVPSLLD
ncbi:hypothetical protein ACN469_24985 [Corallococcus terminator]